MRVSVRLNPYARGPGSPKTESRPPVAVPTTSPGQEERGEWPLSHHLSGRREKKLNCPANPASQSLGDSQRTWVSSWCLGPWKVFEHYFLIDWELSTDMEKT